MSAAPADDAAGADPAACPEGTDPRVVRSRATIIGAANELLLEGGVHATTVDAIAERAGVSKATIYRHWDGRQQLILDALNSIKPEPAMPGHHAVRADLIALVSALRDHLASPAASVFCSMTGAAEHDPELAELRTAFAASRGQTLRRIIAEGIDRGELPEDLDVELFLSSVIGPLFYMRLARGEAVPEHWPEAIVDAVLAAHASAGGGGRQRPPGAD